MVVAVDSCFAIFVAHQYGATIREALLKNTRSLCFRDLTCYSNIHRITSCLWAAYGVILWNVGSPIRAKQLSMAATAGGDMVVRMRKVLAIPRSSYVCFGALTCIKPMYPILFSLLWDSSVRDEQLEKLWWGAGGGVGKFIRNKSALTAAYRLAGFRLDREMRRLILQETWFTR